MDSLLHRPAVTSGPDWRAIALTASDAPWLQALMDANPAYSQLVNGRLWAPGEALAELTDRPPPDWPQGATWHWAVIDQSGAACGYVGFTEDLLAPQVAHLGFFLIATERHGSGLADSVLFAWEAWAAARGARWLRLGVVMRNGRAVRFWDRHRYQAVRLRAATPYPVGPLDISVRVKCLAGASLVDYLARVERDRPPPSP